MIVVTACSTGPAPPPPAPRPAAFIPLGVSAPYLSADVIGGRKARARKMRAAKIAPLTQANAALQSDLSSNPPTSAEDQP